MKTKTQKFLSVLALSVSLMLANVQLNAQIEWRILGNSGANHNSSFVGTIDTNDVRIRTGNAVRVCVNGSGTIRSASATVGYVGIGTTAPATRLHVNGVVTATGGTSTNWNTAYTRVASAYTTSRVPRWSGTAFVNGTIYDNATNVGIGTTAPTQKLHVIGNILASGNVNASSFIGSGNIDVSGYVGFGSVEQLTDGGSNTIASNSNFVPTTDNIRDLGTPTLRWNNIYAGGQVDICGTLRSTEVRVESGWCDYVFTDNYKLPSLRDVENYIKENKHLPEVTPASVIESEGLDLGKASTQMIKKIEELTLYMIQLEKDNEQLRTRVEKLESK